MALSAYLSKLNFFIKSMSNKRIISGIKNAVPYKYLFKVTTPSVVSRSNGRQIHDISFGDCSFAGRGHPSYHININPGILRMALDPEKMGQ
jgi:hypothetical protein